MRTSLVVAILSLAAFSSATVIDDFLPVDNFSLTFGPSADQPGSIVEDYAGGMTGGERDLEIEQITARGGFGSLFFVRYEPHPFYDDQEFFFLGGEGPGSSRRGDDAIIRIQYDGLGDEVGNTGLGKHLRNGGAGTPLFNGADGGFNLWTSGHGASEFLRTTMILRREGQAIASFTRNVGLSTLFEPHLFPFAQEVLGIADSMTIEFEVDARGSSRPVLYIRQIETIVPEPGSFLALGGGAAILLLRRRRRP